MRDPTGLRDPRLAERLVEQIHRFDRDRTAQPVITTYPAETSDEELPSGLLIDKASHPDGHAGLTTGRVTETEPGRRKAALAFALRRISATVVVELLVHRGRHCRARGAGSARSAPVTASRDAPAARIR